MASKTKINEDKGLLDEPEYEENHQSILPPESSDLDESDEKSSNTGKCFVKKFRFVEPAFFLFQLALWSVVPLRNQFVYYRLAESAVLMANTSFYTPGVLDDVMHDLQHGRSASGFVIGLPVDVYTNTSNASFTPAEQDYSLDEFWEAVKSESSIWILYLELLKGVPAILTNLVICAYCDIGGRKIGLILPCLGVASEAIVYIIVSYYNLSISYLAIGHLLEGICGSHLTLSGTAYAYLSDVLIPEKRTLRFAILNAILLVTCMVGNISVGFLIGSFGYVASFWFVVVLASCSILYTVMLLEETVTRSKAMFQIKEIFKTTIATFKIYVVQRDTLNGRTQLILLLVTIFTQSLLLMGMIDLQVIYLVGPPLNFDSIMIGAFLAESAFLNAVGPVLAIGVFKRFVREVSIALFASFLSAVGYTVFAFVNTPNLLFAVPLLLSMIAVFAPLVRAMMSMLVEESEQGALQASISSLNSIADIAGVSLHLAIYSATLQLFRGTVFLVISAMFLVMFVLFLVVMKLDKRGSKSEEENKQILTS